MDFDSKLGEIKVPTMVIAGELDIPTPPSRMAVYREEINGAHVEVINKQNGNFLRMVTTDGHRLSISEGIFNGDIGFIKKG